MTTPPDPSTDPAEPPEPVTEPDPAAQPDDTDWKALAQKWEKRSKANAAKAAQLDQLTESSKTAEQKAQEATERADRLAQQYVQAEIRAALSGVVPDPAAIVEDLNLAKYVTADGEVDIEKVSALRERYAALVPAGPRSPRANPAQGSGQPGRTLTELIGDAEKNITDRKTARSSIALKSQQLLTQRNQG